MADMEKVINGLEHGIEKLDTILNMQHGFNCTQCPYYKECETEGILVCLPMMRDALELLKAQEPVKPYAEYCEHTGTKWLVCGACHEPMNKTSEETWSNYCPNCGREVKWE